MDTELYIEPDDEEVIVTSTTEEEVVENVETTVVNNLEEADPEELAKFDNYEEYLQTVNATGSNEEKNSTEETTTVNPEETDSQSDEAETMSDEEFRQFITGEFKANHKTHQIKDPNDIRKLMQYGMNYHKKMAELAPRRKILKALEQHGLTDESKVNFAIELLQGKPEAIAQLLKQHEIDTYNLPDLEETPYTSGDYIPTEQKIQFDEVISELEQTAEGKQVIGLLKGLDTESFSQVYSNPIMAQNLAIHAETGLMQDALALLETEKALGKVPSNVNDIDAYAYVAKHLSEKHPEKYLPQTSRPKVLGTNQGKQSQPVQHNQAKLKASIPSNSATNPSESYSGIDTLLNASSEDLSKYASWEDYLAKNNLNFS